MANNDNNEEVVEIIFPTGTKEEPVDEKVPEEKKPGESKPASSSEELRKDVDVLQTLMYHKL